MFGNISRHVQQNKDHIPSPVAIISLHISKRHLKRFTSGEESITETEAHFDSLEKSC